MTVGAPAQDARFPKAERLLRRADFVRVQSSGERFGTRRMVVAWTPSEVGHTRVGLTVSRKVGHAPTRAAVKRWLREIYRQHKDRWPAGVDFVVIARPPAADSDYHTLRDDLLRWAARVEGRRP